MITYESQGKIKVLGCAGFDLKKKSAALFSIGSKVFIKNKAKLGRLEFVVIKRIKEAMFENVSKYGVLPNIIYTDTFNRIWVEDELVSQVEAINLAQNYLTNFEKQSREWHKNNCEPIRSRCN